MLDHIFRKYDIRGQVGKDLNIENVYDAARAIAFYFVEQNKLLKNVAIAMDGRLSSEDIKQKVTNAFIDSGLNVIFLGVCPTPVFYFAMHNIQVDAGVMITASHNPKEDNGFKIICNKESVWNDQIQVIKNLFKNKINLTSKNKGTYSEYSIIDGYINWLAINFNHLKDSNIKILIDCANGAGSVIIPDLVKRMNWKNVELKCEILDGNFPNHEPDPTVLENIKDIKQHLQNKKFDFAVGLDGDCDRLAVIDSFGNLLNGDQLLGIFSQFLQKSNEQNSVVFDVKCSSGLLELLEKLKIKSCISPTGISYIKDMMKKNNALLGGELSGHICFRDRYFGYDDGIYAIMRIVEIVQESKKTIQELLSVFPKKISSPEIRLQCAEEDKNSIISLVKSKLLSNSDFNLVEIDGISVYTKYGWAILRASNTQPMLSIRFEGNNPEGLLKIKQDFFNVLVESFDQNLLKNKFEI